MASSNSDMSLFNFMLPFKFSVRTPDTCRRLLQHAAFGELRSPGLGIAPVSYTHLDVYKRQLCDRTSAEAFEMNCYTMRPGSVATPRDYLKVEAVAAYNTTDGHLQFHPKDREDCGYILTLGGSRIYIAGDTEPTPELKALKNIDIAFLPVNQPYTMTVDQAVEAVKAIRPTIFYPCLLYTSRCV